jgi:signal transduction histidine kinase
MSVVPELQDVASALADPETMPQVIAESWERSRAAGVSPEQPIYHCIAEDELRARLQASHDLLETAMPHLPWVSAFLGDIPHVLYISDASGIVLHSAGPEDVRERAHVMPGWDWSEARMGTNGSGTALAAGVPVAVVGDQHYCKGFAWATCLAAPIIVEGKIMGALDLTLHVKDGNPRFLVLITHTAQVISQQILALVALRRADVLSSRLSRLHDLSRALSRTLARSEIADVVVDHAAHALNASAAVGYVLDEAAGALRWMAGHALPDGLRERTETLSLDSPFPVIVAAATGKPVFLPTWEATTTQFPSFTEILPAEQIQSTVALPLQIDGRSIGGIAFSFSQQRELDPADLEYLMTIADHFAIALDRASRFERERVAREAAEHARQELEETESVRERLLGMIGHDLRSPLSAITFAAELLRLEPCTHRHERIGERIANSATRMARMITQLLDFTRARLGGGIPIQRVSSDMGAICHRVVDEIQLAHPAALVQTGIDSPVCGQWDPDRLADVISNLLGNAIEHGTAGTPVEVTLEDQGTQAALRVRNQGPTIPAADLRTIFDPFHRGRVAGRATGRRSGLGLGLYIVEQIVHAHGGTVDVESHDAVTTFTVVLPKAPQPQNPAA